MFLLVVDLVGGLYVLWYWVMFFWVFFSRFCLGFGVCLCWLGGVYVFLLFLKFFGPFFVVFDYYFVVLHNIFCIFYLYLVLSHLFEIHIFLLC